MKFNDIENATITIKDNFINTRNIILNNISSFIYLNIKVIDIYMSYKDIHQYKELIEEINNNYKDFDITINLHFNETNPIYLDIKYDNCFLINHTLSDPSENCYHYFNVNVNNLDEICMLMNHYDYIIVNFEFDINNVKTLNDMMKKVFSDSNKEICLDNYFIETNITKEHPCNSYLCKGIFCGKQISSYPRKLVIDNGNVYIHSSSYKLLNIGKIKNNNIQEILSSYLKSEKYDIFKSLVINVFIKYVKEYPYYFFPWEEYFLKEVNEYVKKS